MSNGNILNLLGTTTFRGHHNAEKFPLAWLHLDITYQVQPILEAKLLSKGNILNLLGTTTFRGHHNAELFPLAWLHLDIVFKCGFVGKHSFICLE